MPISLLLDVYIHISEKSLDASKRERYTIRLTGSNSDLRTDRPPPSFTLIWSAWLSERKKERRVISGTEQSSTAYCRDRSLWTIHHDMGCQIANAFWLMPKRGWMVLYAFHAAMHAWIRFGRCSARASALLLCPSIIGAPMDQWFGTAGSEAGTYVCAYFSLEYSSSFWFTGRSTYWWPADIMGAILAAAILGPSVFWQPTGEKICAQLQPRPSYVHASSARVL